MQCSEVWGVATLHLPDCDTRNNLCVEQDINYALNTEAALVATASLC